jgi:ABC-type taurine transport system ATPase subunit
VLTKLVIRNFKLFDEVEIELGQRVVFVGPNNSGKTSALQALALWNAGIRKWVERRGYSEVPKERPGVTINRRDLVAIPVPSALLLWRELRVRQAQRVDDRQKTKNILVEIDVEGIDSGARWETFLEFDYANEESFYCRPRVVEGGQRSRVPEAAASVHLAYLPPMSGLAASETRLDEGAIAVRIGEGRTAEVSRNLCWLVREKSPERWQDLVRTIDRMFGVALLDPVYVRERGEITLSYRTRSGTHLDLSSSGRGLQQTLLLLSYLAANPGAVLLLDEPDAHLEILRQRQIYQVLSDFVEKAGGQIIAASHSEVILNEAADRDTVIAFVGKPHRIDDRGSRVLRALKDIGFEHYVQAEETGWVLYLEGATDLAILQAFAKILDHDAAELLERPFVHYVGNQPRKAQEHFHALREAKPDLVGIAIYDRPDRPLPPDPHLEQLAWRRREIENYLCQRSTLLAWAREQGAAAAGPLFGKPAEETMAEAIDEIAQALETLGRPSPTSADIKASDDFLDTLFDRFYRKMGMPNQMRKTDYHTLVPYVPREDVDPEIGEKLDRILAIAERARPRGSEETPHDRRVPETREKLWSGE